MSLYGSDTQQKYICKTPELINFPKAPDESFWVYHHNFENIRLLTKRRHGPFLIFFAVKQIQTELWPT